jgi:hypothetical protein
MHLWFGVPAWVLAGLFSLACTLLLCAPAVVSLPEVYSSRDLPLILCAYLLALWLPTTSAITFLRNDPDILAPRFVTAAAFAAYHVLFSTSVIGSVGLLQSRQLLNGSGQELSAWIAVSYGVVAVSWLALRAGLVLSTPSQRIPVSGAALKPAGSGSTCVVLGGLLVALAVLGNAMALGGFPAYILKMAHFYERWENYVVLEAAGGMTKWNIAMKAGPVGLLLLACGFALDTQGRVGELQARRRLARLLIVVSFANVFVGCATGQRSALLIMGLYSVITWHTMVKPLSMKRLSAVFAGVVVVSIVLGAFNSASYYGTDAVEHLSSDAMGQVSYFSSLYLTNFSGTLTLVAEKDKAPPTSVAPAFGGLFGLFGGASPPTTETEIWYRLQGRFVANNPRYGPPGELYFYFGWVGVVIGMFLLGIGCGVLDGLYRWARRQFTPARTLMAVFTVFTVHFLVIANFSYIPSYLTYYSLPFYVCFFVFRSAPLPESPMKRRSPAALPPLQLPT